MTDKTKQRIQELVPEVMELKFGCEVETRFDGRWTITHRHTIGNVMECWGATNGRVGSLVGDDHITEILGSPITLAVVLRAINAVHKPVYIHSSQQMYRKDGTYLGSWNLAKDNYDDQTQETKDFIGKLLGV